MSITEKITSIKHQFGQSMPEYTVVLVFGVLVLTTGPGGDVMQQLLGVIKENYEGYSYAVSLSEPPDYDDVTDKLAAEAEGLVDDLTSFADKDPEKLIEAGIKAEVEATKEAVENEINSILDAITIDTISIGQVQCP